MTGWSLTADSASASTYLVDGWHAEVEGDAGAMYRWSVSSTPRILAPTSQTSSGVATLTLDCMPFLAEGVIAYQDVWVFAGGLFVAFARMSSGGVLTGRIPDDANSGATMAITLNLPNAQRPVDLGVTEDERPLGIALRRLEIS